MSIQALLSPEKYVRTKARNLPIYECIVNPNWQEEGMAVIYIGRKHTNGNITYGSYLVDILCLGLKDTGYEFNVDINDWNELKGNLKKEGFALELIDYNLAHNIIYGGIAFAEEYGFKPHKDFSLTQFILEEDDEQIPLMDIEFGHQGKPHIIVHPEDNKAKAAFNYLNANFKEGEFFYTTEVAKSLLEDEDDNWESNLEEDEDISEFQEKFATLKATLLPIKNDVEILYAKHFNLEPIHLHKVDLNNLPFEIGQVSWPDYNPEIEKLIGHFLNDDYDDADVFIDEIKQAAQKFPHVPVFWLAAADVYEENDRYDEAINLLREKGKEFPAEFSFIVREMTFLASEEKTDEVISLGKTYYPILNEFAVNGLLDLHELVDFFNTFAFAFGKARMTEDVEICLDWLKNLESPPQIIEFHELTLVLRKYEKLMSAG